MANFCGKCGAGLDSATGLCPNCNNGQTDVASVRKDTVESNPKKSKPKSLTTLITILLSISLFLTLLFSMVIFDVRNAVKDDNVEKLLDNVQATDLLAGTESATNAELRRFYTRMKIRHDVEMTDQQLDNFVNRSTVKEFIADEIADFTEDFFEGDAKLKITKRQVVNLLRENSRVIEDELDVYLTNDELQEIANWIFDGDELVIIDTSNLKEDAPAVYYILTIGLSYMTMTVFLILSALIIFFMIKNSFSQAVCGIGIDFIVFGGLTGLVAMLAAWISPLWELICADSFIGIIIGNFMAVNALISVLLLVLGVAMLIIRRFLIKHHARKNGKML